MPASAVEIANLALMRCGIGQSIASLDEASAAAVACNAVYDHCVESTLHAFPWPFATKYATLALVAEDPNTDWLFSYQVPSDCLAVRRLVSSAGRSDTRRIPWTLAASDTGRLIYTDEADAVIEYTASLADPTIFDAAFVDALAWRIAVEVAFPLSVSDSIRARASMEYDKAKAQAQAVSVNEVQPDAPPESGYITARY